MLPPVKDKRNAIIPAWRRENLVKNFKETEEELNLKGESPTYYHERILYKFYLQGRLDQWDEDHTILKTLIDAALGEVDHD